MESPGYASTERVCRSFCPWAYITLTRQVYRDVFEVKITGVGRYDGSALWTPPHSSSGRWDDEEHDTIQLPVMQQCSDNGRHGFVLHDSCWSLLQKASEPTLISIHRLVEVCESLPFPLRTSTVCWGHDFGGLWAIRSRNAFAWQEEFFQPRQPSTVFWDGLEDPFDVSCIPKMLAADIRLPFAKPLVKASGDCFALLPWELCVKVAILLSTNDALNLRRASASFLPLYTSGCFWASRFSADGERGFLFEAQRPRGYLGWLTLYKLSRPSHCPSELRNRQRVWGLTNMIANLVQRHRGEILPIPASRASGQCLPAQVSCDIRFESEDGCWNLFHEGCRSLGTSIVTLPSDLIQIGITTIEMGTCTYVTGIHFMSKRNHSISVGYVAEPEERIVMTNDFYGFRVAISQSGMRALQLIGKNERCSQWIGNPTDILISDRLVRSEAVRRLAVSYDVSHSPARRPGR